MSDEPSERLLDQRYRNRIIESIELLARGPDGVRAEGADDYFEYFFDWVPDGVPRPNSAITEREQAELAALGRLVDEACVKTRPIHDDDELIATGWPDRLTPDAQRVLALFSDRGRFSDDIEQDEPG